ncbi:hypothetical protein OIU76_016016 [Salix suchowensis]|nr:protein FAM136A [Salix suchowensis]KAJ6379307.1 hypothetical protein OIU76_016016 [Salix suchowensis]KAJ6383535.1 hypothetical protein OIU78_026928 [Salix suchowensis]
MADHIAAMEAQMISERMRRKLSEVNSAAQVQLSPVQDHINFTLQQAYFKCAYECFDRRRKQEEISNCVEHCSVPVLNAQNHFENEMARFQEKLNRSLMVCQDKFETAKAQQLGSDAVNVLESCVDQSIQDNMKTLPHLVVRMKQSLAIRDEAK